MSDITSSDTLWKGIQSSTTLTVKGTETLSELPASDFDKPIDVVCKPINTLFEGISILSLDISLSSTGVFCRYQDKCYSYNLPALNYDKKSPYSEVLLRRSLLPVLLPTLPSRVFDYISIEDAFSGRSHTVARSLYALNTAVDEALLDGVLETEHFCRVNNVSWKRSLTDDVPQFKRYTAKLLVTSALGYLMWNETQTCEDYLQSLNDTPKGVQDRRDAFGIAYHTVNQVKNQSKGGTKISIKPTELCIRYMGTSIEDTYDYVGVPWNFKPSLRAILNHLQDEPYFYNAKPITLGFLDKFLDNPQDVPALLTQGYFLFYVKGTL